MFSTTRHEPRPRASATTAREHDLPTLRTSLVRAAAARQTQLLNLRPVAVNDTVALAYHASMRRIFDEIHAALDRMDAGTYGACLRCDAPMALDRLADRPWVPQCDPCTSSTL